MVEKESPANHEVREYYIAEEKTPLTVNTLTDGGYDFKETIKRPSKGMIWQFEKSTEDTTSYQSRNPVLPGPSEVTFWEENEISRDMVMTALDACKETYVGSYSEPPYTNLSDSEFLAGESERDPGKTEGMSKS